jgi:PKD repeat protein
VSKQKEEINGCENMKKKITGKISVILMITLMISSVFGSIFGSIVIVSADVGDVVNSFDSPMDVPWGLAWDNTSNGGPYLWVGGFDLDANGDIDPDSAAIYKLRTSGEIVSFFNINHIVSGLAWDGINLWSISWGPTGATLYKLTTSGDVVKSWDTPGFFASGLTWDGEFFWYSDCENSVYENYIRKIVILEDVLLEVDRFDVPHSFQCYLPRGLAWDDDSPGGPYLWYSYDYGERIYKLIVSDDELIAEDKFASPGDAPGDLAWDGVYLWNTDGGDGKIYQIDVTPNDPPDAPSTPSGPTDLIVDETGTYTTSTTDPDDDNIYYIFDWDDDTTTRVPDSGYVDSGTEVSASHSWNTPGYHDVTVQAIDEYEQSSELSPELTVCVFGADAGGPYKGFIDYYVTFKGRAGGGTPPYMYRWDFDNDGNWDTDWRQNPIVEHTYASEYQGKVKLKVKDDNGRTNTDTASVKIKNLPPVVDALLWRSGVTPSWDGEHLSATIDFVPGGVSGLINIDGSVPGEVDLADFSGDYSFMIGFHESKMTIDLYPYEPENDKVKFIGDFNFHMDTYVPFGGGGEFNLGARGDFEKQGDDFEWDLCIYLNGRLSFPLIYVFAMAGPVPVSAKASLYFGGDVDFYLSSPDEFDQSIFDHVDGSIGIGGNLKGGVGIVDIASIGLYCDVYGEWEFTAPEVDGSLYKGFTVTLTFGAYGELIGLGEISWEWYSTSWPSRFNNPGGFNETWQFMARDYNIPTWVNDDDGVLMTDAFPASHPSIARNNNGDKIMVWTQDDLSKGDHGDGLELWYSTWDGNTEKWNIPLYITNDNRGQSNPTVVLLDDGTAICVFNYLPQSDGLSVEEMFSQSEIGYTVWDGNSWSSPQLIVNGGTTQYYMDSYPVIKSYNNQAVVLWMCDQDADVFTVNDRVLYASFWGGNSWDDTRIISNENVISVPVSLAFKDGEAVCAYAVDEDGTLDSRNDQSIYLTTFSRLDESTNCFTNVGRNARPSVSYIGGNPSIVWVREKETDEDLTADILYKPSATSLSDPEIVESGLDQVSSGSLFYGDTGGSLDGDGSYIPLVVWNEGNRLCYKRRFDNGWESKKELHLSSKNITQVCWDYTGGDRLGAVFVEKNRIDNRIGCKLMYDDSGEILKPNTPATPDGPESGFITRNYEYSTSTTDYTGELWYNWSWGDNTYSGWMGPYGSGATCTASHSWTDVGTYEVSVKAKNRYKESDDSPTFEVKIGGPSEKPFGSTSVKRYQTRLYTTTATHPTGKTIYYQWNWSEYKGDWYLLPRGSDWTVIRPHTWFTLGKHNVSVRITDDKSDPSRYSPWSEPLTVTVTKRFGSSNNAGKWVRPNNHDSSNWRNEKYAHDAYPYLTHATYDILGDGGWCDDPLTLRLNEPIVIKGFKIRARNEYHLDEMELTFYKGDNPVTEDPFTYNWWYHLRYHEVYFDGSGYEVDKVEIRFHEDAPFTGFGAHPAKIYGFYFWQPEDDSGDDEELPVSHADAGGPYEGYVNYTVGFDGSGSLIINGTISNCTWEFGDGDYGYELMANHIYTNEGEYKVNLTITADNGTEYSDTTDVTITTSESGSDYFDEGSSCFLAGTNITMANGSRKKIENITEEDIVLAYDLASNELVNATIIGIYNHTKDEMPGYYIVINNHIRVTPNHLLYINGTFLEAENARVNDTLLGINGSNITITSIYQVTKHIPTYNLGLNSTTLLYFAEDIAVHHLKPTSIALKNSRGSGKNFNMIDLETQESSSQQTTDGSSQQGNNH